MRIFLFEQLDAAALADVAGGMINLYDERPRRPPIEPGHGGIDTPYWATDGAMRFGAGPWDYGYGSPTGPWPV
jgi:hypothetical protein